MYRLLLVDDHVLFREGMHTLISHWDDIEVVGEASNGDEGVRLARELMPDIVLMDISMPVLDGIQATRQITRDLPGTRVVMLTISEDDDDLFEAIRSGAHGYVLKNIPSRRLHNELRGVLQGQAPLSGLMAAKILKEFNLLQNRLNLATTGTPAAMDELERNEPATASSAPAEDSREYPAAAGATDMPRNSMASPAKAAADQLDPLTDRERQVLELLADGLSNADIAERICLSENTVKKHLHNILQKLHLNNRVEAAMYAVREGLVRR